MLVRMWQKESSCTLLVRMETGTSTTCNAQDIVQSLGQEDPPEKEMATPSSIPAWRIPWMEEPGG